MTSMLRAVLGAGFLVAAIGGAQAGDAPPAAMGPIHVTGYIEVVPTATNQMLDAAKQYRDASKAEAGAMTVEIYQELGAPSRLVTREIWRDEGAYTAHSKAASVTALNAKLKPIEYGPTDYRAHDVHFGAGSGTAVPGAGSVVIVSHLDVTPNTLPALTAAMVPLGTGTARENPTTYQILRQTAGARNHFRLFEIWPSEQSWEAHNLAQHTQIFRDALAPMLGTPYDQRKYQIVN